MVSFGGNEAREENQRAFLEVSNKSLLSELTESEKLRDLLHSAKLKRRKIEAPWHGSAGVPMGPNQMGLLSSGFKA